MAGRVTDLKNKTVEELKKLKELGMREISLGVESDDDWTLDRIHKGYHAQDILEQCRKLEDAGIDYWMTFLNGVAGKSHSRDHAIHSAQIFSQCRPMLVGTGGLTLFPGTPLLEEAQRGVFDPLSEKEMLEELKLFVENLTCDCAFITHHTVAANLTGGNILARKDRIIAALDSECDPVWRSGQDGGAPQKQTHAVIPRMKDAVSDLKRLMKNKCSRRVCRESRQIRFC